MKTYRLGSISGNSQRPLIDNETNDVVAIVRIDAGPATIGDMTIEQVVNSFAVLLSQFVRKANERTDAESGLPVVTYIVSLPGRPEITVRDTDGDIKVVNGARYGTNDFRMAIKAVAEFAYTAK